MNFLLLVGLNKRSLVESGPEAIARKVQGTALQKNHASQNDDSHYIEACRRGDKSAFGALVEKYMRRAYFAALGLTGSPEAALDLSQDAFVRAWRAIRRFQPGKAFFPWYYRILRNLCFNYLRDRRRHARPFSEIAEGKLERIRDKEQDVEAEIESEELRRQVWEAIDALKPQEREILLLREFDGMRYDEIAEALNIPKGTVMSRLFNARRALKQKLLEVMHE